MKMTVFYRMLLKSVGLYKPFLFYHGEFLFFEWCWMYSMLYVYTVSLIWMSVISLVVEMWLTTSCSEFAFIFSSLTAVPYCINSPVHFLIRICPSLQCTTRFVLMTKPWLESILCRSVTFTVPEFETLCECWQKKVTSSFIFTFLFWCCPQKTQ